MPQNARSHYRGAVVSVGGPPHSGKSVFVTALFDMLVARFSKDVFLERACPDGEGRWSAEAPPDHVGEIRRKQPFSEEFVLSKCRSIENLGRQFRLVLVDLGGKLAPDVTEFLGRSTHCILLSSSESELGRWEDAVRKAECELLAAFESRHVRGADGIFSTTDRSVVRTESSPWTGTLVNLDRDASSAPYEDAVRAISDALVDRFLP